MNFVKRMKRGIAAVLAFLMAMAGGFGAMAEEAAEETGLENFPVYHGSRQSPKIALTVDDCNDRQIVLKCVELCERCGKKTGRSGGRSWIPDARSAATATGT